MSDSYDWDKEDKAMQARLEAEGLPGDDLPDTSDWDPAERIDPKKFDLWTPARCVVCGKHLYYLVPVGAEPLCDEHAPPKEPPQ